MTHVEADSLRGRVYYVKLHWSDSVFLCGHEPCSGLEDMVNDLDLDYSVFIVKVFTATLVIDAI